MANKDCKITVRIPENILIQVENISKDLNISINDAYKMVIKAGVKTFI